jgi:hypothetical protein
MIVNGVCWSGANVNVMQSQCSRATKAHWFWSQENREALGHLAAMAYRMA